MAPLLDNEADFVIVGTGAGGATAARVLAAAGREIASVRLATFRGVLQGAMLRVVRFEDRVAAERALTALTNVAEAGPLPWGDSAALFVNADHDIVRLARRHARRDPTLAAQLLGRALLLTEGPLEKRVVDHLLDAAVGRGTDV